MKRMNIVVIGDSHTRAIAKAARAASERHANVNFDVHWLVAEKEGEVRGDLTMDQASDLLSALAPEDLVVLSLVGTSHNILGLLRHQQPFWVLPSNPAEADLNVGPGTEIIPRAVLREMFEEVIRRNKRFTQVPDMTAARVVHMMPPPPKEDNDFLQSKIDTYRGKLASEYGISAPALRLRMWEAEREALTRLCAERGSGFLDVPVAARDREGYLQREFYADDATHANVAYGDLLLEEMVLCARRDDPENSGKRLGND